ncbi:hypothetical protein [Bosea sp. 2RAB26]|uniref:hypothetical protein n=1 Tax=Bosea sp. 2RAB26 TaxID=3237476 RepID=UPI003F8E9A4A
MFSSRILYSASLAAILLGALANPAGAQDARKDATASTKAANQKLLNELPFSDKSDFRAQSAVSSRLCPPR